MAKVYVGELADLLRAAFSCERGCYLEPHFDIVRLRDGWYVREPEKVKSLGGGAYRVGLTIERGDRHAVAVGELLAEMDRRLHAIEDGDA